MEGRGIALLSPRERDENMKPLQLPWGILGIVGTQETRLDPLIAQSIFDIAGGPHVALL